MLSTDWKTVPTVLSTGVPLYSVLSGAMIALENSKKLDDDLAQAYNKHRLEQAQALLPSGSGFDSGVKFLREESSKTKLVFQCDFHHMNDIGYYIGWSYHKAIVTIDFTGLDVRVTGRDRRDVKDYIAETIYDAVNMRVQEGVRNG